MAASETKSVDRTRMRERAAEYLQLPRQETEIDSARIVGDFKTLLDHAYVGRLGAVTDNPEPTYDPQLEPNQQRAGEFSVDGKELPVLLVRVADGLTGFSNLVPFALIDGLLIAS